MPVLWNDRFFFEDPLTRASRLMHLLDDGREQWGTLREEKDRYVLVVPLPGLSEKDVEVSVQERAVTLKINRRPGVEDDAAAQPFSAARSLQLPVKLDADRVAASMKNGLLTVSLPRLGAAAPRQVPVAALPA